MCRGSRCILPVLRRWTARERQAVSKAGGFLLLQSFWFERQQEKSLLRSDQGEVPFTSELHQVFHNSLHAVSQGNHSRTQCSTHCGEDGIARGPNPGRGGSDPTLCRTVRHGSRGVAPASPILRRHDEITEFGGTFSSLHYTLRRSHGERQRKNTVHRHVHRSVHLGGNAKP